jgi:hypothetical protein
VGETASDYLATNLNLGLTNTTFATGSVLLIVLFFQFRSLKYVLISVVGTHMAETVTSLVQQFASMKPNEFSPAIQPKWQVAERLVTEIREAVEKKHLTPLDGARVISSITATLFGYDEFILREVSPETFLAASSARR